MNYAISIALKNKSLVNNVLQRFTKLFWWNSWQKLNQRNTQWKAWIWKSKNWWCESNIVWYSFHYIQPLLADWFLREFFSICAIKYPPILRIRIGCAGISASEIVSFPSNPLPSGTEIYAWSLRNDLLCLQKSLLFTTDKWFYVIMK